MSPERWRTTRPMARLREGRADWYSIKNLAGGPTAVYIYDEVGYFGVTAQDFIRDLAVITGDIELHLSTPGGEVFDGIAIHAALKQRAGNVSIVVDSLAASIGSVIAMAASPGQLSIMPNASVMIHDGFGLCIGNAADMREQAELLDRVSDNIASIYADRTGKPKDDWRAAMLAETWYIGQEAVDAGLADRLAPANAAAGNGETITPGAGREQDDDMAMAATFDLSVFRRTPAALRNQADPNPPDPTPDPSPATSPPPTPEAAPTEAPAETDRGFVVPEAEVQGEHGPEPGSLPEGHVVNIEWNSAGAGDELLDWLRQNVRIKGAAFRDGDPDHDDHGGEESDCDGGMQDRTPARVLGIESMPLMDKSLAVHHTDTVDETWDGPAAVAAMPNDDKVLRYCHAWMSDEAAAETSEEGDDDADDKKDSYRFPHHKTEGGPANLAACRNGLARLSGADIPDTDRAGVKAHLQAHLDDANGDDDSSSNHDHTDIGFVWDPSMTEALKEALQ